MKGKTETTTQHKAPRFSAANGLRRGLQNIDTESIEKLDDQISTTSLERDLANFDKLRTPITMGESKDLVFELESQHAFNGSRQSSNNQLIGTKEKSSFPPRQSEGRQDEVTRTMKKENLAKNTQSQESTP